MKRIVVSLISLHSVVLGATKVDKDLAVSFGACVLVVIEPVAGRIAGKTIFITQAVDALDPYTIPIK